MAQRIFWNWQDEDSTFDLSRWLVGIVESGLYRGFDPDVFDDTMQLKLIHSPSGAFRTNIDRTLAQQFGVVITKQGCIVQEDSAVFLEVEPSTAARQDLVVLEHEYKEIAGGINATIKIIKGENTTTPVLTNPNIQVVLGYLKLPANCTKLSDEGVEYVKAKAPYFANNASFIEKENGFFLSSLDARGNKIINLGDPINGKDAANKDYVQQAILESVKVATETQRGIVELADLSEALGRVDDTRAMTSFKVGKVLEDRTASQVEANADTVGDKFITPKTLGNRTATPTRAGVIRVPADDAEAGDATNNSVAITPYYLSRYVGFSQKVVEIGAWNFEVDGSIVINHAYDWWNKVVGQIVTLQADDQTRWSVPLEQVTINATTIGIAMPSMSDPSEFNSTAINRGWIVFFVKNDLVQPSASLSVNAGPDQSGSFRLLEIGTPVLGSVEVTYNSSSYPQSLPKLKANITQGLNNNLGSFKMYAKRKNPVANNSWNNWTAISGTSNPPEGYITDTDSPNMDGQYLIKVVLSLFGVDYDSNVVEVNLTNNNGSAVGTVWNAVGNPQSTVVRVLWNLNGNIEAIGSPLNSLEWTVDSAPNGATYSFSANGNETTTFFGDKFGEYVLRLTAVNDAGQSAYDTVKITITEIQNQAPTASAKWSDGTNTDKTIEWQVYNPYSATWYGYYSAVMNAASSIDPDGYVAGYQWQFNYNNAGWQDVDDNASGFPNTPTLSKVIQGDGNWKFRVRVKDNLGLISNWGNELSMNITGSSSTVVPLDIFNVQVMSGGAGQWHTQAQLNISPVNKVFKLEMKVIYTNGGSTQQVNDCYVKITGNGQNQWYITENGNVDLTQDLTSIMSSSMGITVDLNNTPPYKFVVLEFKAYDILNNLIGSTTVSTGHL